MSVSANRCPKYEGAVVELAMSQIHSVWMGARPQSRMERRLLRSGRTMGLGEREHCPDVHVGRNFLFSRLKSSSLSLLSFHSCFKVVNRCLVLR